MVWTFIQDQILGMKWLKDVIGGVLSKIGLDVSTKLGGGLQFFIYDVIKITVAIFCWNVYFCIKNIGFG